MNMIRVAIAALSLVFACGCQPLPANYNPNTLSPLAYQALLLSGLFVKEGEIFTTKYHEGYNLNFEISEAQAQSLLPPGFTPTPLQIIEGDPDDATYYLSFYMAVLKPVGGIEPVTRIDLFTYGEDLDNEPTLMFVSSYISVPQSLIDLGMLDVFHEIFDFFARDSATGLPAYSHYYTETLTANSDNFNLVYPDNPEPGTDAIPSIGLTPNCGYAAPSLTGNFTLEFIVANSQIYRNGYDKNVNYFNQSFISANVETRNLACVEHSYLAGLHPMLDIANLKSVQFYGSPDEEITWYYETCTYNVCKNPFVY